MKEHPSPLDVVVPQLVYTDPESGQEVTVDVGDQLPEITIGRNPGNVVRVNNPSISRQHAKVVFDNGQCTLIDLDSSNGSYINGNRIRSQVLVDGDRIRVGEFPVDFRNQNDSATAEVDQEMLNSVLQSAGRANGDFRRQTAIGGFGADDEVAEQSGPVGPAARGTLGNPFGQWDQQNEGDDAFEFVDRIAAPEQKHDSGPLTLPDDAIVPVGDDDDEASDVELLADDLILEEQSVEESDATSSDPDVARSLREAASLAGTGHQETVEEDVSHLASMTGPSEEEEEVPELDPWSFDVDEPDEAPAPPEIPAAPPTPADDASTDHAELEARIAELELERDELAAVLEERAGDASAASQVQIERLRNERDRLIEERRNLKRQITDLKQDLQKAPDPTAFEQMQGELEGARADVARLERELETTREAAASGSEAAATAGAEIESLREELAAAQTEAAQVAGLREEIATLQSRLEETEGRVDASAREATQVENDLAAAQNEIQQLVAENEARDERIAELEASLNDTRGALHETEQELEMAVRALHDAHAEIEALRQHAGELQAELDARPVSEEVDRLVKELAQTRAALEQMTGNRDDLDQKREDLEAQLAEQKKTTSDALSRHDKMERQLSKVTKERDQLKAEKGAYARETDYLQAERRKHDSELRDLRKKVQKLEKDDKRKKQVFAELSADLKKLVKENTSLQEQVESLQRRLDAAPSEQDLADARSELREANKTVKSLEKDTDRLTRELGALSDERDKLKSELAARDDEIGGLRKTADAAQEAQKKADELQSELESIRSELDAARAEHESARNELEEMKSRAAEVDPDEIAALRKKLTDAEQTLAEVILERDRLEDQLKKKKK